MLVVRSLPAGGTERTCTPLRSLVIVSEWDRWSQLLAEAAAERTAQPERICHLCVEMLRVSGAGISMVTPEGNRGIVCATDATAGGIEDLQLTTGVGPCIDAVMSGSPVLIADIDEPGSVDVRRWPGFTDELQTAGVRAVFAFPLRI